MAERRMFAKTIIDSDAFLDMPLSAQALYFHLSMRADDEGFLNNAKKIQRMLGASDDDLKLLIAKNFVIPFESGIVVIKHWRIHNYIQRDRFKGTVYQDEKQMLEVKQNGAYTLTDTECIQDVYSLETQDRIGKDRIGKDRIGNNKGQSAKPPRKVYFPDDEELNQAFADYVEMRSKGKHPIKTDRAVALNVSKLQQLATRNGLFYRDDALEIINQSIERGWSGFYELKTTKQTNQPMFT